jgi:predicted permease
MERELAEEMEAHRAMLSAERRLHFGNATRLSEATRDVWSWVWLEQFLQDLAYGIRVLRRSPGFTLGAVVVLALGVGVNLAEVQIFDAILNRLTFRDADSVVRFSRISRRGEGLGFPHAAVEFYRAHSRSFDWLVAEDTSFEVIVEGEAGVRTTLVSSNYFSSLGILPAWGRLLDARDSLPGAAPVAVLSREYWEARWGGDPHVIGRVVRVNNRAVEIIGVLPYDFQGLMRSASVWLPAAVRPWVMTGTPPLEDDYSRASEMFYGKLKDGVTPAVGEAELTSLTRELSHRQPHDFREGERIQAAIVQESFLRRVQHYPALAVFIVMVLLVLLSACANLGNMLLARGMARRREIDIRAAIGASRARVVRQLMTENVLLAILGAAAGIVFGAASVRFLLVALNAPPGFHPSMKWSIPVFAFGLALVSAAAFGLPSALRAVHPAGAKVRLRQTLIGVQVAVSCLLLIASAVLARNGMLSAATHLAFDYTHMVVVDPQLHTRKAIAAQQRLDQLSARLGALPGVEGVTAVIVPPLGGRMRIAALPGLPRVYWNPVAPNYFGVMGLAMVRGRTFLAGEPDAAVVSESAARAVWPNEDPLGKSWLLAGRQRTVVGVVRDSGANLLAVADSVEAYVPITGPDVDSSMLIIHTKDDPAPLTRMIPAETAALDETVSVFLMRAARENILDSQRKLVTVIGSIGVVATVLAAAGMFALIAFAVAQRKRELGIRIAIGAGPRQILRVLLAQNARPTALGTLVGAILALVLWRLVRSLVFLQNHSTVDLVGFAAGIGAFLLVAALATLSPAMRALRIDPSETLREE